MGAAKVLLSKQEITSMNIIATRIYHGEWIAVDDDTYDGAIDSKSPCGIGSTEAEAISDLIDKLAD